MSLDASDTTTATADVATDDRIADVIDRLTKGADAGQVRAHRVQPAQDATFRPVALSQPVEDALATQGVDQLYAHQAAAIDAVRTGENVVLATPTASGKSLIYAVPALERALDHDARTLYLAPQRALINDQEGTLQALARACDPDLVVGQYKGQLSKAEKQALRERQPHLLLTTPDMLNASLLPFARRLWAWFFQHLALRATVGGSLWVE